jgi:hypothetical protein
MNSELQVLRCFPASGRCDKATNPIPSPHRARPSSVRSGHISLTWSMPRHARPTHQKLALWAVASLLDQGKQKLSIYFSNQAAYGCEESIIAAMLVCAVRMPGRMSIEQSTRTWSGIHPSSLSTDHWQASSAGAGRGRASRWPEFRDVSCALFI